mmetsp:Transcript_6351/g.17270  ORF Transcript_6351/g.17270 Transcript_6351/m.17270 type:complete len:219 (-) Transcript_6351:543-1199(-)
MDLMELPSASGSTNKHGSLLQPHDDSTVTERTADATDDGVIISASVNFGTSSSTLNTNSNRCMHTCADDSISLSNGPQNIDEKFGSNHALVGSRYMGEFVLCNNRKHRSIFTVTKKDIDEHERRYELSMVLSMMQCTLTTTQIVQELESSSTSDKRESCHVTVSYAVIPNNWRGRIFFCFIGKRLHRDAMRGFQYDMEDLEAEGVRRRKIRSTASQGH